MKRLFVFVVIVVFLFPISVSAQTRYLSMVTGGVGGVYYPLGTALAGIFTKYLPDVTVNAEVSSASVANCNAIRTHKADLALVQNNVASWAYIGMHMFKGKAVKNIRGIAMLYPETIQIVTLRDSGIKDITDLKGKIVSIGAPGSGTTIDAEAILGVCGIKLTDLKVKNYCFAETVEKLKNREIDAGFVTAGYPVASIMKLALAVPIRLVYIPNTLIKEIHMKYPYYVRITIPKGTYNGLKKDILTVSCMAMLVADARLPSSLVYRLTKTMWEHIKEIYTVHPKAKYITLSTALQGLSIPLHPGAEKFYMEKKMLE